MVLNVDPWITFPWHLVNPMATALLPGITEIMVTDPAQVDELDIHGIIFHPCKDFINFRHILYDINIDIIVKKLFVGLILYHLFRRFRSTQGKLRFV